MPGCVIPVGPGAQFHRLHSPVSIDTAKAEGQEQDEDEEDEDEGCPQCGHHLFHKKEKEH